MPSPFVHDELRYQHRGGAPGAGEDYFDGVRIAAGRPARTASIIVGIALTATFLTAAAGSPATVGFENGVLTITGDAGNNGFKVGSTPAGTITLNGVELLDGSPTRANVATIHIDGGVGDDTLIFDETNGALPNGEFIGGEGRNAMIGGSGADTFVSGAGSTGSPAVAATTPSSWGTVQTSSPGTPETAATMSTATPARTPCWSTARTPRKASASALPVQVGLR